MQKKIIALAIASALVAPSAFADTSNVSVYGLLNADFESVKSSNVGAGVANTISRVSSNATRLGIKGKEDLGAGLNAIYQLEIQADLNGNAGNGFGNGTRNSHVGLNGDFGTAFLGIWDTPYKTSRNKIELFDNTTFSSTINVLGRTGSAGVNFNNRLANSVQYWTPDFNGFQAKLAYGTDNASTTTVNKSVISLSAAYEDEMLYAAYGYESFKDVTLATAAATAGNKADGNRLVGAYKFAPESFVGLTYERLSGTAAGVSSSRTAWELAGKYTMGNSNFGLAYVKAGNTGAAVVANGANQVSLRYGYSFSKRTELYGMYSSLSNDAAANYNLSGGTIVTGSVAGAKLSGFGLGMVHKF
ncbi:MAG: porin [Gallionella sp.]|nr:porin [Gallionella sp.]